MKIQNITAILAAGMLSLYSTAYAQEGRVGVNTTTPKTTLDVNGKKDTSGNLLTTDITGLQAPRLTRAELTAKGNTLYGADQKGALVYITDISGGDATSQRINITAPGYYYFDGTVWVKVSEEFIVPEFSETVWVDNTDPNTATTFDDKPTVDADGNPNPDYVDDPTLEQNTDYIYQGTDGSSWIWNGTAYVTYKAPNRTEWWINGTTVDAGGNKTGSIYRPGSVGIGVTAHPDFRLTVYSENDQNTSSSSLNGILSFSTPSVPLATSGLKQQIAGQFITRTNIASGVNNTGFAYGTYTQSFRGMKSTDNGTLSSLTGVFSQVGNYSASSGANPITANVYGVIVTSYTRGTGTITNFYDYYASAYNGTGTTVTNKYGVYILGADKTNYFQGKLGIGTNAPERLLDLRFSGTNNEYIPVLKIGNQSGEVFGGSIGSRFVSADQRQGLMIRSNQTLTLQGDANGDGYVLLDVVNSNFVANTNDGSVMRVLTNGNVGIGTTTPQTKLAVVGLPVYADNAAAITAGLQAGDFYRTTSGVVMVVY